MMKTIFATLCALTAVASADEREPAAPLTAETDTYLSLGGEYTSRPEEDSMAVFVDGGYRLKTSPLFVHGRVTVGERHEVGRETRDFEQVRVGLEARGCVFRSLICTFAGVDVGVEHEHNDRMSTTSPLVVPRAGVEFDTPLRFRFSVEMPLKPDEPPGLAGSFSVGYSF